jgi:hypothetical protein
MEQSHRPDFTQPSPPVLRGRVRRVIEALRDRIFPSRRAAARRLAQVARMAETGGTTTGTTATPARAETNGSGSSNGHATSGRNGSAAGALFELPGDVRRQIDAGEIPDPIWYVGRTGPSVQDVLDADGDELERLRQLVQQPTGDAEASRRPGPTSS